MNAKSRSRSWLAAVSTVEGVLQRTVTALEQDQPVRRHMDPEGASKIEEYVAKIKDLLEVKIPFHIVSKSTRDLILKDQIAFIGQIWGSNFKKMYNPLSFPISSGTGLKREYQFQC